MSWLTLLVIALTLAALAGWAQFLLAGDGFRRLAAKNADLAVALLALERDCLVETAARRARKKDFVGPITLTDTAGQTHSVYIPRARFKEVLTRVTEKMRDTDGSRDLGLYPAPRHAWDAGALTRSQPRKRGV